MPAYMKPYGDNPLRITPKPCEVQYLKFAISLRGAATAYLPSGASATDLSNANTAKKNFVAIYQQTNI
jgi:hypothetical protein